MYYAGESNVPGAPGNLMAAGIPVGQDPRLPMSQVDFEREVGKQKLNRILGPIEQQRGIQRFREVMGQNVQGALNPGTTGGTPMGNAGFYMGPQLGQVPQGPNTPLPTPGWNPSMIKAPGNPEFRPSPMWERPGPTPGSTVPWQAAGFQNKTIS